MERLALVTGGMGAIGTAICRALADEGHRVIATTSPSRSAEATGKWLSEQESKGYRFESIQMDVCNFEHCASTALTIKESFGIPGIVVNNAGITRDAPLKKMTFEQWKEVMEADLYSLFNVTRQFINEMIGQGWGRIVNISSINGQKGQFGQTNYSAAKAGMHGFTMALAQETARHGITVNTVSPGYTETPMVTAVREDVLQKIIAQIPMGRLATAAETASVVRFLCSEEASFISGANIPVNGVQFTSH